ncbi:MAG: hypothetical protein KKI08_04470 [Armatimonadetes bacterium]|nr:hypothetical protein [Armatimonadota bacterium]
MSRYSLLLVVLALPLLAVSCRHTAPPPASEASHIRIEPSRPLGDPQRDKPTPGVATAQEVGMDFYPGAEVATSSLVRDGRGLTAVVELTTRDSYTDVTHFYLDKYGRLAKIVNLDGKEGRSLALNWQTPSATLTVDVKQDLAGKRTLIHLVRLTGKRSPPPASHSGTPRDAVPATPK